MRISDWSSDVCSPDLVAAVWIMCNGSLSCLRRTLIKIRARSLSACKNRLFGGLRDQPRLQFGAFFDRGAAAFGLGQFPLFCIGNRLRAQGVAVRGAAERLQPDDEAAELAERGPVGCFS